MPAYAVALIRETRFNPEIKPYLEGIDATLAPFSGKYLVHGGPYMPLEGAWAGDMVVIEFPSMEQAQGWYDSAAYKAIRPFRCIKERISLGSDSRSLCSSVFTIKVHLLKFRPVEVRERFPTLPATLQQAFRLSLSRQQLIWPISRRPLPVLRSRCNERE